MSDATQSEDVGLSAEEIVAAETGARSPKSRIWVGIIVGLCVAWSLFQLAIANNPIDTFVARSWHLGFALALVFLSFPAYNQHEPPLFVRLFRKLWPGFGTHKSNRDHIPIIDIVLAIVSAGAALYIWFDNAGITGRGGLPLPREIWLATILTVLLLEATRRALGAALTIVAIVFIVYLFFGHFAWLPDVLRHRHTGFDLAAADFYLSTTGIFGVPLGVSAGFVYLFVLFGSMLDKAGAGKYFIDIAFAGLGHYRGGPAKAAIVASGMNGMVSGSSIANTVTTGTFTIPLMKKTGLPAYKAAAVEVAASTNGQLMPPIMGAAAFIMAEIIGIPYLDVVRAALIPAVISYLALFYVVDLEAQKLGLKGIPKNDLPKMLKTFLGGLQYLLPLLTLLFYLAVVRRSPIFSALAATETLLVIMVIQRPIIAYLGLGAQKKAGNINSDVALGPFLRAAFVDGLKDIWLGLIAAARNMMPIGVATATAGIIVGVIVSTGLVGRMVTVIAAASFGNVSLMLILTAVASLILGMGLPTTANYILMATLTAPVIVQLGGDAGLVFPLIAAHLFVFYFGILADDTPPVGLAAYAASAIARSHPIKTGIQGFTYDMRTAILPFVFIFNTELLMISGLTEGGDVIWINDPIKLAWVFVVALAAIFAFAAAMQGFFADECSWPERILLIFIAVLMFRPSLLGDPIGVSRVVVQGIGLAAMIGLHFMQKRRRGRRLDAGVST